MDEVQYDIIFDEFFTRNVWLLEWEDGIRLTGLSLKCEFTGYLAVLRGISAEGPKVAFLSKPTLKQVYSNLKSKNGRGAVRWRPDRFKLDNLEKSG